MDPNYDCGRYGAALNSGVNRNDGSILSPLECMKRNWPPDSTTMATEIRKNFLGQYTRRSKNREGEELLAP